MESTQRFLSILLLVAATVLAVAKSVLSTGPDQNITTILNAYPQYSTFNSLLTKTGVASEVNSRNSITVLVVDNSVLDPVVSSLGNNPSTDQLADIMRYYVMLSYFNQQQLQQLPNNSITTPTLYQTTGRAVGQYGTLNVTDEKGGKVGVGVPYPGAPLTATVVKTVQDVLYNLSVLQISAAILPMGVVSPVPAPAPVPVSPPAPAPAVAPVVPATSPKAETPASPSDTQGSSKPSGSIPTAVIHQLLLLLSLLSVALC